VELVVSDTADPLETYRKNRDIRFDPAGDRIGKPLRAPDLHARHLSQTHDRLAETPPDVSSLPHRGFRETGFKRMPRDGSLVLTNVADARNLWEAAGAYAKILIFTHPQLAGSAT
jgi:hypothetical protein